ncbi:MAG: hypothetical protein ABI175_28755 [Polyangiales bacterium]
MPAFSFIKPPGQVVFASYQLKLPSRFKPPDTQTARDHYKMAFKSSELSAMPQLMPPWFFPAEAGNKYYVDSCDQQGNTFKSMFDDMLDAVGFAHNMWKLQAKFKDLKVMAVSAIGMPGCLDGPELEGLIKKYPPLMAWTGQKAKYRDAIAKGVSKKFKEWQDKVTVPGLPWYPAFAAFPGPMAPPMPNIPMPLAACISPMMTSMIVPMQMRDAMVEELDGGLKDKDPDKQHKALFDAIATVISVAFATWLPSQMVIGVLGKGPIPTFAPPYVPVGPVVAGDIVSVPGHLAT